MSLYTVAVPAPSQSPRGPTGGVPGADVTLGWQRGEGLGPAAKGAGASPSAPHRAAPSDSPVRSLAVFLASGGGREGVKPIAFGPFRCSSAGHLQISTIHLLVDLETM